MILLEELEKSKQKNAQSMTLYNNVEGLFISEAYMEIRTLSKEFYSEYGDCEEILKKITRPYYCLLLDIDEKKYAIPFRHHIKHPYAFITIGEAGLDFSKAVIISDERYLTQTPAIIDQAEFNIIKRSEQQIKGKFRRYIHQYKRALRSPEKERSKRIIRFSTLRYFLESCD